MKLVTMPYTIAFAHVLRATTKGHLVCCHFATAKQEIGLWMWLAGKKSGLLQKSHKLVATQLCIRPAWRLNDGEWPAWYE
jgi:hypothetical protein